MITGDKFSFNNVEYRHNNKKGYCLGKLVHAVVRFYVDKHPNIMFDELKRVFPDYLNTGFGVFEQADKAKRVNENNLKKHKRYFTTIDELINIGGGEKIAVTNQWAQTEKSDNFNPFIEHTQDTLKYKIEKSSK